MAKKKQTKQPPRPLLLRPPGALQKPIDRDAKKQKVTAQTVILQILAKHYDVEIADPVRGRPPNKKS